MSNGILDDSGFKLFKEMIEENQTSIKLDVAELSAQIKGVAEQIEKALSFHQKLESKASLFFKCFRFSCVVLAALVLIHLKDAEQLVKLASALIP